MVANGRSKLAALKRLIEAASGLPLGVHPFSVSNPRSDGTVVIRFRSTQEAAVIIAERVAKTLTQQGYDFTQVDDVRLVFPLSAIPG